jgi:MoaA/NifB/PqqE/SkfB family radical SAM enzyme
MKIQLSLSTKCNIHCPFCLKESLRKNFRFVENIDIDFDVIKKVLDHNFENISICSNRGEALFHPQIDDILLYAKEKGHKIRFSTNAFYKNSDWWKNLGKLFDKSDSVWFPLDGVGNKTHNMHRGSDFYTVLRNIESFINAGGIAVWKFIKFEHNQHQIELARELAKELGCRFDVMNSHTYNSVLKKPTDSKVWTNENIVEEEICSTDYIPCDDKKYYVSAKGILFPCCFLANIFAHDPLRERHREKDLVNLFNKEKELLDIRNNDIDYIISNSEFFKEALKKRSYLCKEVCLKWTRNQIGAK